MVNFCRKELLYALVVLMGSMNFGFVIGYTSPAIPQFEKNWGTSKMLTTWFNAIFCLFAIIGPFIATYLLSKFGRKPTLSIIASVTGVFWCILCLTSEKRFWIGIVVRGLLGLSVGAYSSITPMYLIELAPKDITGFFGSLNQFFLVIGIIWMYLQGNWYSWMTLNFTGIAFSFVQAILVWAIPETAPKKIEEPLLQEEQPQAAQTNQNNDTLWQKKYMGKLMIGVAMMIFQQFSGVNAILTNLDANFREIGVPVDSGIASAIAVTAQLIAVGVGGLLVDWLGRRLLWCISACGCASCLWLYALNEHFNWANWLPIVFIFFFMFFFGSAMGPIPWFIVPELFPDSVRSMASSVISMVNQICSFVVIFLYPWMKDGIGNIWTLALYGIITFGGFIFGIFFITEPPKDGYAKWGDDDKIYTN